MSNLDELKELTREMQALLEQEELGCSQWHSRVHELIDKFAAFHED